jgi:murein hydrolase activator
MRILKILIMAIIIFFIVLPETQPSGESDSKDIKKRQKELEKLNNSINTTRKRINQLTRKEKNTLNKLYLNQKHNTELGRYLNLLDTQINDLQLEIQKKDSAYFELSTKLSNMISAYSEILRNYYINKTSNSSKAIFADKSSSENIKKTIYIEYLGNHISNETKKINFLMIAISSETGYLKDKFDYQEELQAIKQQEKHNLAYSIRQNKRLLTQIKKDSKYLQKQLENKMRSAKKLKNIIAELIRKEAEKSKSVSKNLPIGIISWPCNSKNIVRSYGNVKNKETNTFFDNPGIDIGVKNGTPIKSIADAEVSLIHWLPGYGTLVILNHGNNLRSVYANLSAVSIKKGDRVKKGEMIGKSGESVEGEFLHFELWQGKTRLNPADYLR